MAGPSRHGPGAGRVVVVELSSVLGVRCQDQLADLCFRVLEDFYPDLGY
jgi:hypothetical protein